MYPVSLHRAYMIPIWNSIIPYLKTWVLSLAVLLVCHVSTISNEKNTQQIICTGKEISNIVTQVIKLYVIFSFAKGYNETENLKMLILNINKLSTISL